MHTKIRAMDKMLINNNNFKFFFQEYFEPVFQFARKYTENDAIARDFTQDAFIKLYEKRKDFDVSEKPNLSFTTTLIFA
ncbi:MAG: RNA polymerase sigma factor [Butyricimonas faecalis]